MQSYESYDYTPRKRKPKVLLIVIALAAVALAAGLCLLLFGGKSGAGLTELPVSSGAEYGFTEKGMLAIEGNMMYYIDLKGEKQWEVPLTDENCRIATSADFCVLYTDNVVQAMNTGGEALFPSIEFSGRVLSVRCGSGFIAVLKEENDGSRYIYIYDAKGTRTDKLELKHNAMLDYGFDEERGNLYTLMVNTDSSLPVCTVSTYNVASGSDTGAMTKEGQVIERVYFGGGKTYAVGTNHLTTFTSTGKEEKATLIYGWRVMDFQASGTPIALLCVRQETRTAATVAAKLLYAESGAEYGFRLNPNTIGAYFMDGKVLVVQSAKLSYYDLKGNFLSETALDFTVDEVEDMGSKLVLKSGEKLYLMG